MSRKSFRNITRLFLVKGGSVMLAVILAAGGLLFLSPLPAGASGATCVISATPTELSLTSGDYETITIYGSVLDYTTDYTTKNSIQLSTNDASVVAIVSQDTQEVVGNNTDMSATFTVNARGTGIATVTATFGLSTSMTGSGPFKPVCKAKASVDVVVTVSSYNQPPTDLQSSYSDGQLEIVRGTVDGGGNKTAGSGFTVSKDLTRGGAFQISYTNAFSETPTLIVSPYGNSPRLISPAYETQYSADIFTWDNKGNQTTDTGFSFVAIGKPFMGKGSCPLWKAGETSNNLQVIRGHLGWNGSAYVVLDGKGFYVNRNGVGGYTVTFLKGFSGTPTVVVAPEDTRNFSILTTNLVLFNSFNISAYKGNDGAPDADSHVEFTAIGPSTLSLPTGSCGIFGIEPNPLQVASGRMSSDGSQNGNNYGINSMSRDDDNIGDYIISYSAPFIGNPAALSTIDSGGAGFAAVRGESSAQTEVLTWKRASGDGDVYRGDKATAFVAIGPIAPPPTATISADNTTIDYNTATNISWSSTNATACKVSSPGWTGTSGTQSTGNLTASQTYTVTCTGPTSPPASASVTVTVNPAAPSGGTIVVSSTNSQTGELVPASWCFTAYQSDPCASPNYCGQSAPITSYTYNNMPAHMYTLNTPYSSCINPGDNSGDPSGYSFRGVRAEPQFAFRENKSLGLWGDWFARIARAFTISGCGTSQADGSLACSLPALGNLLVFNIDWDPEAKISVISTSPAPLNLAATAGGSANGTITLGNTGTAGSKLEWTSSVSGYSPNSGSNQWLSVSTPDCQSDSCAITKDSTVDISVKADTSIGNLPAGNYSATVTFTGTSSPSGKATNSQLVTVNLTVNNPVPAISSLSPSNVTAGGIGFTLTVFGRNFVSGSAGSVVKWNGSPLATNYVDATRLTATVPAADIASPGTASVTVFNPTLGGGTSNAAIFTVNWPQVSCGSFTASPAQLVIPPPASSTLSWSSCENETACRIDPGVGDVTSLTDAISGNGSVQVSPTSTTAYTLTCSNPGNTASYSTTVKVFVVGYKEQ